MAPIEAASGKWFQKPRFNSSRLMSIIITTNKNKTMTAPTYTSTKVIERNSALSNIQIPDA
jgi:hypothetical protein